jgi:hypothetical protein
MKTPSMTGTVEKVWKKPAVLILWLAISNTVALAVRKQVSESWAIAQLCSRNQYSWGVRAENLLCLGHDFAE